MSTPSPSRARLVGLRRAFHRYPETAWTEFWTTARIVEELRAIGVDELLIGAEVLDSELRMSVPDEQTLAAAHTRAADRGVDPALLEACAGGHTGCVGVLTRGEGPTVGLRVDIDALPQRESADADHAPAADGFASERAGMMHACGHDAHATIGIGVLERIADSDFQGTLKVFFQPAEEVIGGGRAMAAGEAMVEVDHLLALHVGLDYPTGTVVAGIDGFLAVAQYEVEFTGRPAHAGAHPEDGSHAIAAAATATHQLQAIARHADGATRVNVGRIDGGTATNIIPESCTLAFEVRGETTALCDHMRERATATLEGAARSHGCGVEWRVQGEAPSATSDASLVDAVATAAGRVSAVGDVRRRGTIGGSEDATYLMRAVQEADGDATYVGIGTDHPGGHHTATFDVDEESLMIGVETITRSILALDARSAS